jgi:hypothetical protein
MAGKRMNLTHRPIYQKGQKPAKVKAIRNAARDMDCTLRIPGVCRHDPAYTVGCHLRLFGFAGMGDKPDDLFIIDACDKCHAAQENRSKWAEVALGFEDILLALMVTQRNRRAAGLITLEGE